MDKPNALPHPSRDEILQMPPFERLPLERIHLVRTDEQAAAALHKIAEAGQVGFDTESRPLFKKDATQEGPHVVQLATLHEAYIVQVNAQAPLAFLREVLGSAHITKVGFGLQSDRGPLLHKLGIQLAAAIELDQIVRRLGYLSPVDGALPVRYVDSAQGHVSSQGLMRGRAFFAAAARFPLIPIERAHVVIH